MIPPPKSERNQPHAHVDVPHTGRKRENIMMTSSGDSSGTDRLFTLHELALWSDGVTSLCSGHPEGPDSDRCENGKPGSLSRKCIRHEGPQLLHPFPLHVIEYCLIGATETITREKRIETVSDLSIVSYFFYKKSLNETVIQSYFDSYIADVHLVCLNL